MFEALLFEECVYIDGGSGKAGQLPVKPFRVFCRLRYRKLPLVGSPVSKSLQILLTGPLAGGYLCHGHDGPETCQQLCIITEVGEQRAGFRFPDEFREIPAQERSRVVEPLGGAAQHVESVTHVRLQVIVP